ncbi:hypothetical protein BDV93DRAFT_561507 [Ceratobasidium sp. AG-I]|nr:hypothetical protein BDV93DRAFT_561507 [Ceratobasidium sp. AG-I]
MLSSVCVRWRHVAISTSSLWSHVYFTPELHTPKGLLLAKLYLERSSSLPLSLCTGRFGHEPSLRTENQQLADLLRSIVMRLESLSIISEYSKFFDEMFVTLLEGSAGHLRRFALSRGSIVADARLPRETLNRILLPLHTLYLHKVKANWDTIPCQNLVELQLINPRYDSCPTGTQLVRILNTNPAIRRLALDGFELDSYAHDLPPIELLELRTLQLGMSSRSTSCFLALLVPGPHELDLRLRIPFPLRDSDKLATETNRGFFQQARVVSLRIFKNFWMPFLNIATHLPYLETLQISDLSYDEYYDEYYDCYKLHGEIFPPKLHTVELIGCNTNGMDAGMKIILSLPSVRGILFSNFYCMKNGVKHVMSESEVREWTSKLGITAGVTELPHSRRFNLPCPLVW